MIKAKKLRIGNYYRWLHEESESTHTVDIEFLKIQHAYDIDPNADEFARGWWSDGIPLTEEWLLKFGFISADLRPEGDTNWSKDYDLDNVYFGRIIKVYKNQYEYIGLANDGLYYSVYEGIAADESACLFMYGVALQYVHSLQNAWPFITGQELQLTT